MAEILDILNLGTQTVSASSTPNIELKRFYATVYIQCITATATPVVTVAVSYDGGTTWSDVAVGTPGSTSYAAGATITLSAGTVLEVPTAGATNIKLTRSSGTSAVVTVTGVQFPAANRGVLANLNSAVQSEDAAHTSGDKGIQVLGVRKDSLSTPVSTDGDYQAMQFNSAGRLYVQTVGDDSTNNILKSQPKTSVGSGGRLTADGTLHSGACTLMGVLVHATTGGTVDISDAIGAAGTSIGTIYCPANNTVYVPFPGVSMAVGVFGDITTLVGSMVAFVGPAVV